MVPRDGSPGRWPGSACAAPAATEASDLHQGDFDADERAIPVGVRVLVAAALLSFS